MFQPLGGGRLRQGGGRLRQGGGRLRQGGGRRRHVVPQAARGAPPLDLFPDLVLADSDSLMMTLSLSANVHNRIRAPSVGSQDILSLSACTGTNFFFGVEFLCTIYSTFLSSSVIGPTVPPPDS